MSKHIADKLVMNLCKRKVNITKTKILIMGCSFKENCKDIRNSKVFDLIKRLEKYSVKVEITDPLASNNDVKNNYNYQLKKEIIFKNYSAIIVAVSHDEYKKIDSTTWLELASSEIVIFDVKNILPRHENILRL